VSHFLGISVARGEESHIEKAFKHTTVLLHETVAGVKPEDREIYVDCTAGGGGHTALLLERSAPLGRVIALDRDPHACAHLKQRFADELKKGRLLLLQRPFSELKSALSELQLVGAISGIVADIGVSSPQIDDAERGFSFMNNGPLDMRMSGEGLSAADVVNGASEFELARIFYELGEEVKSRQIARSIVNCREARPFLETKQLADFVKSVARWHTDSKKHAATKVFQALRIHVNQELGELTTLVHDALDLLKPKGRLAIISFHSLEDRIIKHEFQKLAGRRREKDLPKELAAIINQQNQSTRAEIIKPFPTLPSEEEVKENYRSRSAKLRILEKTL